MVDPDGEHPARIEFDEPLSDPAELQPLMMQLVGKARRVSGEDGTTSIEREVTELTGTRTFLTRVLAVSDVHPHLRMVTLGGVDLVTFSPLGPDTFLYVLLPPPSRTDLTIDQSFAWSQVPDMAEDERPVGAYYTLRAWRPDRCEVDILMVLHGDTGPASAWAARAQPGDPVALWGPRTAYEPPAATDSMLLIADETGLPALANILALVPDDMPVVAVVEVDGPDRLELRPTPATTIHWLNRRGAPAGTTTLIADLVRTLDLPGERTYVWGGGESRALTAVRRHVRDQLGRPRDAVSLVAYWRHATSPADD
ncbi:MAG: siderophore-interacting protein [Acidimicrobiia bacterium]|nr:siderophore-interacting protein [Acidimicrobiia bacterium]